MREEIGVFVLEWSNDIYNSCDGRGIEVGQEIRSGGDAEKRARKGEIAKQAAWSEYTRCCASMLFYKRSGCGNRQSS